jgi:hypothetical protein
LFVLFLGSSPKPSEPPDILVTESPETLFTEPPEILVTEPPKFVSG